MHKCLEMSTLTERTNYIACEKEKEKEKEGGGRKGERERKSN